MGKASIHVIRNLIEDDYLALRRLYDLSKREDFEAAYNFASEESVNELVRNIKSMAIYDAKSWVADNTKPTSLEDESTAFLRKTAKQYGCPYLHHKTRPELIEFIIKSKEEYEKQNSEPKATP